jgi:acyl-CoA synthetase (AMP-forming)/AMP-acid ligase II
MTRPEPDTDLLLRKVGRGDASARSRLLDRHRDRLRQIIAVRLDRRLAARVDPSDVVQDVLLEADRLLADYVKERPLPFFPWLRQIAGNKLMDLYRRHIQSRRRSVNREELSLVGLPDESAWELADRLFSAGSGQILVRTPDLMFGYWNDSLQTFQVVRDGWLYTGDLGRCDADDYVWFHGRLKDLIVRDGSNIAPAEVEEALASHPAVAEAVVVGVDDPPHGQAVEAFVRWRPGLDEPPTVEQVRNHVAGRIQALAVPRMINAVTEWPRTGQGKIDRQRLQWIAAAGGVGL